jgi:hypothetical protein
MLRNDQSENSPLCALPALLPAMALPMSGPHVADALAELARNFNTVARPRSHKAA